MTIATCVVIAYVALTVGFGLGIAFDAWLQRKTEATKACKRVWIFVSTSMKSGRNVYRAEPWEILRHEDMTHERVN